MFGEEKSFTDKLLNNLLSKKPVVFGLVTIIIIVLFYFCFLASPSNFPKSKIYDLKHGQTLSGVALDLSSNKIIKSEFFLKTFVYIFSFGKTKIIEGDYAFPNRQNVLTVAWRITHGILEIVPLKVTIPEGLNSKEIADLLSKNLPSFDKIVFLNLVKNNNLEGYLFPDTYFLMPNEKENEIIRIMNDNFNTKIITEATEIKNFGKSTSDIIKMASIVEEEATTLESRKIVAGILWRRIALGMPLQVDSSFKYINGKTTKDLTVVDLDIDSPYNSYTHKGLPPTPISNPGLESIKATLGPQNSPYLYFLTGSDGNMHYAKTFAEHVANKQKYLK